jgi:hypothetical protein
MFPTDPEHQQRVDSKAAARGVREIEFVLAAHCNAASAAPGSGHGGLS